MYARVMVTGLVNPSHICFRPNRGPALSLALSQDPAPANQRAKAPNDRDARPQADPGGPAKPNRVRRPSAPAATRPVDGAGAPQGDPRMTAHSQQASGLDAVAWLMADALEQLLAEHDVVR